MGATTEYAWFGPDLDTEIQCRLGRVLESRTQVDVRNSLDQAVLVYTDAPKKARTTEPCALLKVDISHRAPNITAMEREIRGEKKAP